jgi:prevent-host-death family protein
MYMSITKETVMLTVTASKLRNNIFEYLDKVKQGETVTIILNKKETAMLVPVKRGDWRDSLRQEIKLNCSPEKLVAPLDDVWEEYV